MFKNYLKVAIRNLKRNKLFSFINIFGLALSMSVCLLVLLRLKDQLSYDKFHPDAKKIYRILTNVTTNNGIDYKLATTPLPLAPTLHEDYNVIDQSVRIYPHSEKATASKKTLNVAAAFTEPSFFKLFDFKLGAGDPRTALLQPNTIVLTEETAKKFFGSQNAIGEVLTFEKLGGFTITGVLKTPLGKSHIDKDAYLSISSVIPLERAGKISPTLEQWSNGTAAYTYVTLKKGATEKQLLTAVTGISSLLMQNTKVQGKAKFEFEIQKFKNIILGEELQYNLGNVGSRGKILAEISIAFIILLSACFNYTNLSIARSLKRGKEVGIRKVAGAFRLQVFNQFIVESVMIALLSLAGAYVLLKLIISYAPFSSEMIPKGTTLDLGLFAWFLLFSLLTGILAGVLPAWTLSSFKPVEVLKNLSNIKLFGGNGFRKTLIVVQFTLSLVITIFTITFYKQFDYAASADPGFRRENLLNIPLNGSNPQILANEISSVKGVELVSASSRNFGHSSSGRILVKKQVDEQPLTFDYYDVDRNFIANMKLSLLAGQTFDETNSTTGENSVILNETALPLLKLNMPEEAVGKIILLDDSTQVRIAGVVKDFYFLGVDQRVNPLLLRNRNKEFNMLNVSIAPTNKKSIIAAIEKVYKKNNPYQPFEFSSLDDELYKRKSAWGTTSMLGFLTIITITLACLGLLGMIVYNTETRRKEIGIRKVMGASVTAIITLLSRSFLKLVVIAGLIALPIGYVCSYLFLNIFANRISVSFVSLAFSFLSLLFIVLIIITSQVYKVAIANPVNSLRTE